MTLAVVIELLTLITCVFIAVQRFCLELIILCSPLNSGLQNSSRLKDLAFHSIDVITYIQYRIETCIYNVTLRRTNTLKRYIDILSTVNINTR